MNICKLHTDDSEVIPIDKKLIESRTEKDEPYYPTNFSSLSDSEKAKVTPFAVCPNCDNPIQIIGLYKKLQNTDKPYGKHYGNSVKGLASYDAEAYEYCGLAGPKKWHKSSRKTHLGEMENDILRQLAEHFDRAIYIISQETGIVISKKLAEKMLNTYLAYEGFLYRGATRLNAPWILAYMSNSQPLFGQVIRDGDLKEKLKGLPNIIFNERGQLKNKEGEFVNIKFCFMHHETVERDNKTIEVMKFVVSAIDENNQIHRVLTKEIIIEPIKFQKLKNIPPEKAKRNEELLALGKEVVSCFVSLHFKDFEL